MELREGGGGNKSDVGLDEDMVLIPDPYGGQETALLRGLFPRAFQPWPFRGLLPTPSEPVWPSGKALGW